MTNVTITGLWLRRTASDDIQVLIEREGKWYCVITERGDVISHIVEPAGMLKALPEACEHRKGKMIDFNEETFVGTWECKLCGEPILRKASIVCMAGDNGA